MKKLIILVALLIAPLISAATDTTGSTKASVSSQPVDWGQGIFWVDSLWNGVYVLPNDSVFTATDTTVVLDTLSAQTTVELTLNFEYDWLTVTIIDTGTTYTDSCVAEFAAYEFGKKNVRGFVQDTIKSTHWNAVNFLRDSTWTNGNFAPNNNLEQTYTAFVGGVAKIRFRMTNAEAVENRIWKFIIQASRKK